MKTSRLTFAVVFAVFASLTSFSQTPIPEVLTCSDEVARFLVEQLAAESKTVAETDKRIRILTRSAAFLWKFDQPTAREYFAEAFKVAADRFSEKGFEKIHESGMLNLLPDYRFEVIRAIASKDGEWAKSLTETVLKEFEKAAADRKEADKTREVSEIMWIARENVKTNPQLSWYLFRRVMRQPLDSHWYFSLYMISRDDKQFADQLYVELIRNYANETPRRLLFLSAYPFVNDRIFGIDKLSYGTSVPETLAPNFALQGQFIETFLRRVSTFTADPENVNRAGEGYRHPEPVYMISALQDLEPIIIERFPALMQRLAVAKSQAQGLINEETRKKLGEQEKYNEAQGHGFDRRLELVEKADEEGKLTDFMIVKLLIYGVKEDDQFKRIEPWLEKLKDEKVRGGTTNYFWFLRSKLAIKESRIADAGKFAGKVPEIDHRSILMFEIAEIQLKNVNDPSTIYETLGDVGKLARQTENSIAKARVLLGLANMYERVNHSFALDELGDAIKVINRIENADMLTKTIRRQVNGKDFAFYAMFQMPGYDLENTFTVISKKDFDMSLSNARSLEDKFLRTIAVLAIAKNCVNKPKPERKNVKAVN